MLFFGYDDTSYSTFLERLAGAMHTQTDPQGILHLPINFGKGYLKALELPNQLQALLFDFTLNTDIFLNRNKSSREFYTLNFDEINIVGNITVKMGTDFFSKEAHLRSAVLLTSSLDDFGYIGRKGTAARGVHIMIGHEWMSTHLGIRKQDKAIEKYIALKTASFNFEPLDAGYRHLLNEIMDEDIKANPMRNVMVQNRVMLLIERFFSRLYEKMSDLPGSKMISEQELQQLMKVESLLVKDFSKSPPSLPELARLSMMSQTKLKSLFKKVYSLNPYEYYQKNRMHRAKYLLNTRQLSVKQVGSQLGFKNLSNFTIAFKKEFGMLPKEV